MRNCREVHDMLDVLEQMSKHFIGISGRRQLPALPIRAISGTCGANHSISGRFQLADQFHADET
jgi:hypothetical protein